MTQGEHPPAEAFRPLRDWAPTGFTWLLRMHGTQNAGDALVAVSLANTLFFSVPIGEARGRVALYLLVTMAPFAVVAPFIGPMLDRTRSGRRLAIAGTMGGRALLVWIMASNAGGLALYPAAFGVLVLSRGYAVARAAVVPRVLPRGSTLVGANARLVLTGACAGALAATVGAGIGKLTGPSPSLLLRLTALVFAVATYFAFRLPATVNAEPSWSRDTHAVLPGFTRKVGAAVIGAASLRALAGFLMIFLAFRIKTDGGGTWQLVALIAAGATAGIGGTGLGALARQHEPEKLVGGALATATVALLVGMVDYGFVAALGVVAASGLAGSLVKLGTDTIIQRDIAEDVRAQAFARSETVLQLAWVAGGAIGLVPLPGGAAFAFAAAVVGTATVFVLRAFRSVQVA